MSSRPEECPYCGLDHPNNEACPAVGAPAPAPAPEPAPQPEASLRDIWMLIGRIEERTRAGRVIASWKRYVATHQPEAFEMQAILSKVALEILCSTEEPDDAP